MKEFNGSLISGIQRENVSGFVAVGVGAKSGWWLGGFDQAITMNDGYINVRGLEIVQQEVFAGCDSPGIRERRMLSPGQ
jgi:hypothetical protein